MFSSLQFLSLPINFYVPYGTILVSVMAAIGVCLWIYSSFLIWEVNFAKKRVTRCSEMSPSNKNIPKLRNRTSIIPVIQDLARKHKTSFGAFHIRPIFIERRQFRHLDMKLKGKVLCF